MENTTKFVSRIFRLKRVCEMTGLSRSTIYLKLKQGLFPKPISLGSRSVGWLETDILEWIASRVEQSRPITKEEHV